jgi:Protein of unknown function (DUF4245)
VSEQAGRYQRSAGGLVGALVVLVVLLLLWVAFRSLTANDPDTGVRTVDYAPVVQPARQAADFDLVAPASLPPGWRATSVRFTDTVPQHWHLGLLTGQGRYVGLEQGGEGPRSFVEQYVDEAATRGASVDVAGRAWTTYTDAQGDLALVRRERGTTTLVVGHDVPRSTLESFTAGLR